MDMFNEYGSDSNVTHQVKHRLPFLGWVAHYLSDIPGPDEYERLKDLEKKALKLAEDQHHQIDGIKRTIVHDHVTIVKLANSLNKFVGISSNITNELKQEQKLINKNVDIDTMYSYTS